MEEFCEALDLQIDPKKTYCWTTDRAQRKDLKDQNIQTLKAARDLGGHMNYSKWMTKTTILEKIEKFSPFWRRLSRSAAPKFQKLRCLKVSAWPNMFHSIAISSLGHVHFEKIRTKVMQSMGFNTYGANPKLQLSCISPSASDPEFWCAYETVLSWRKFTTPELADFVMTKLAEGNVMTPGPCSSLTKVLHRLGWQWIGPGIALDHDNQKIAIRVCPIQELFARVCQAWQIVNFGEVESIRKTMTNLRNACVVSTMKEFETWNSDEQGVLRCALNGTLYTNDALVHTGKSEDATCKICGAPDSIRHRHWECPFFKDLTDVCTAKLPSPVQQLPDCLTLHGWIPKNQYVSELKKLLCNLPNLAHHHFVPFDDSEKPNCLDVFTDGSCVHPTIPEQRVATWGVVLWHNHSFHTIAEGGVPGYHQTSLRGEIWAAVAALSFAVQQQIPIRIWIDNQTVCDFLNRLLTDSCWNINPEGKDADLWEWLSRQFKHAKHLVKQVIKVKSHVEITTLDDFEEWVIRGNNSADLAAKQARKNLPSVIWDVWEKVVATDNHNNTLRQAIHTLLVSVGMRAVQSQPKTKLPEPSGTNHTDTIEVDANMVAISNLSMEEIPQHFLVDETQFLLDWLGTVVQGNAPARWVSWHQLLIDYQFTSGRAGPRNIGRRWRNVGYKQADYSFGAHAKWFSHYFQNLGRALSIKPDVQTMRPPSHVLTYWGGSTRVRISTERLDRVDSFLKEWATRIPARNLNRDLSDIPRAKPEG